MIARSLPAVLLAALVSSALAASPPESARLQKLVDEYYAQLPLYHPTVATELGLHEHDGELESMSPASLKREEQRLLDWQRRLAALDPKQLAPGEQIDLATLRAAIDAALVEHRDVQGWRRRPDFYTGLASRSLYAIIKRDFAPADQRLRAAIAREEKIPALLADGKKNLAQVSSVAVDIALDEIDGIVDFFKKDVPLAFAGVLGPCPQRRVGCDAAALRGRLDEATLHVVAALVDYRDFLRRDIKPRANAPFAIGEAVYRKKLHADELIDAPLDELLARGEAELHRLQAEFKAAAARIDPKKSVLEVQAAMQKDHGTAEHLIADTQARLEGLRKFLGDRQIVSLPSQIMPRVEETPPFMRATTLASMDTPGVFETRATEAFYNVTLPERSWTPAQIEDYLGGAFARPTIDVTSIHEAFPGHYVQFLWTPRLSSKVRKVEGANTNVEGWAHYCEQMMLDEGYGAGDAKLKLAQLQDALLRAARFVVGIRIHTRGMSFDDAVAFFEREGFQQKKVAQMETRRGTEDPTYLYYTLGKLEILRLRDDYKRKLGGAYSLRKFHDAFLAEGAIPLPLMRRALLGE